MTYLIVWDCLVSVGHITLIKGSIFGSETWLIKQNLTLGKGCVIEKLWSTPSKENGSIVISNTDHGKLPWDHKHVLVLDILDHGLTLPDDWYCGTLSLRQTFFASRPSYVTKLLSLCMQMPGVIQTTGQLFMAVRLIGCGSVPILRWVFYLSQHPWEAPGWQVIAIDTVEASYHPLATDTRRQCLYRGI